MGAASRKRTFKPLVLSYSELAFVLMLRPFSPELIMIPDVELRTSLVTSILRRYLYKAIFNMDIIRY